MLRKPVIGLTTYGKKETGAYHLPAVYIDCVRRAGGVAVLVPPDAEGAGSVYERLDGVVFTGGGDINPDRYEGAHHEQIYNIDDERDDGEFRIAEFILEKKIPTLAICRGIQVLNVFLGGTLHAHIPEVYGEIIRHRLLPKVACEHAVTIMPGTRLESILGQSELNVVSWHHQALRDVAGDMVITARSPDGVIEGIEIDSHPWLVGVQWHPELSAKEDPLQQRLFNRLVQHT
ncbi:gamma-glutamyl-gamma-aminobutyrate hydrolase family protein [bacterium]|nr:gamma-glutamyl-gamma-aminobutyrate hydrolase family protein [bacterium]